MTTFYKAEVPVIESFGKSITRNAFRQRLTFNERVDFETKATPSLVTDPTPEKLAQSISLKVLKDDLANASHCILTLPEYVLATQLLTTAGILAEGRADQVLNAPVRWIELLGTDQDKFVEKYGLEACLAFDATMDIPAEPVV